MSIKQIDYKWGYVKELLKVVKGEDKSLSTSGYIENLKKEEKSSVIVVNNIGHGDSGILELLIKDFYNEGFKTQSR